MEVHVWHSVALVQVAQLVGHATHLVVSSYVPGLHTHKLLSATAGESGST